MQSNFQANVRTREKKREWNPYVAGALTGLLIVVSVLVSGNYFGTSTSFLQIIGMIEKTVAPYHLSQTQYFTTIDTTLSWQIMFITGIFIGGLLGAKLYGDFKWQFIPDLWESRFGVSPTRRGLTAFVGGIIAIFGARLAGGCPSGQMSSFILLSMSALIAMGMFFVLGIITVHFIYKGGAK